MVEKVLNELLLEGPGCEEAMEVGAEKLSDEVDVLEGGDEDVTQGDDLC